MGSPYYCGKCSKEKGKPVKHWRGKVYEEHKEFKIPEPENEQEPDPLPKEQICLNPDMKEEFKGGMKDPGWFEPVSVTGSEIDSKLLEEKLQRVKEAVTPAIEQGKVVIDHEIPLDELEFLPGDMEEIEEALEDNGNDGDKMPCGECMFNNIPAGGNPGVYCGNEGCYLQGTAGKDFPAFRPRISFRPRVDPRDEYVHSSYCRGCGQLRDDISAGSACCPDCDGVTIPGKEKTLHVAPVLFPGLIRGEITRIPGLKNLKDKIQETRETLPNVMTGKTDPSMTAAAWAAIYGDPERVTGIREFGIAFHHENGEPVMDHVSINRLSPEPKYEPDEYDLSKIEPDRQGIVTEAGYQVVIRDLAGNAVGLFDPSRSIPRADMVHACWTWEEPDPLVPGFIKTHVKAFTPFEKLKYRQPLQENGIRGWELIVTRANGWKSKMKLKHGLGIKRD